MSFRSATRTRLANTEGSSPCGVVTDFPYETPENTSRHFVEWFYGDFGVCLLESAKRT